MDNSDPLFIPVIQVSTLTPPPPPKKGLHPSRQRLFAICVLLECNFLILSTDDWI